MTMQFLASVRRNQRQWMVVLTIMSIFAFLFDDVVRGVQNLSPMAVATFFGVLCAGGMSIIGYGRRHTVAYAVAGFVVGGAAALIGQSYAGPRSHIRTKFGTLTPEAIVKMQQQRMKANQFLAFATDKATNSRFPGMNFGDSSETSMVYFSVMQEEARRQGIAVSNDAVVRFINAATQEALTTEAYRETLREVGLSEAELFSILRTELEAMLVNRLLTPPALNSSAVEQQNQFMAMMRRPPIPNRLALMTPEQLWQNYRKLTVRQALSAAAIPVTEFVKQIPEPGETELRQYFEERKSRVSDDRGNVGFLELPKVKLAYLVAKDLEYFEKNLTGATDQEVADYYEKHKEEYRIFDIPDGPDTSAPDAPADATSPENVLPPVTPPDAPAKPESTPDASKPDAAKPDDSKPSDAKPDAPAADSKSDSKSDSKPESKPEPNPPEPKSESNPEPAKDAKPESTTESPEKSGDSQCAEDPQPAAKADAPAAETPKADAAADKADADKPDAEKPAEPAVPEKPVTEVPATDKSSTDKPAAEKPADPVKPADSVLDLPPPLTGPGVGPGPGGPLPPLMGEAPKKYRALDDDLKLQIREKILLEKAFAEMTKAADAAMAMMDAMNLRYLNAEQAEREKMGATFAADCKKYAEKHGMEYQETRAMTRRDLEMDLDERVGMAFDTRGQSVADAVFETTDRAGKNYRMSLYAPQRADAPNARYAYWKIEEIAERVPDLKEEVTRELVVKEWKFEKARELAEKRAAELADIAKKASGDLAAALSGQSINPNDKTSPSVTVRETPKFTWLRVSQSVPGLGGQIPVESTIDGIDQAGPDFLKLVCQDLANGDVGVGINRPRNTFYVVRVHDRDDSSETGLGLQDLQQAFLKAEFTSFMPTPYDFLAIHNQQMQDSMWHANFTKRFGIEIDPRDGEDETP